MKNIQYSNIICAKCNSENISLEQMRCMDCGNKFTDEDVKVLLDEVFEKKMED